MEVKISNLEWALLSVTLCCPDYCLLLGNNVTIPLVWGRCAATSAAQFKWKTMYEKCFFGTFFFSALSNNKTNFNPTYVASLSLYLRCWYMTKVQQKHMSHHFYALEVKAQWWVYASDATHGWEMEKTLVLGKNTTAWRLGLSWCLLTQRTRLFAQSTPPVTAGKKWNPSEAVQNSKSVYRTTPWTSNKKGHKCIAQCMGLEVGGQPA